MRKILDKQLYNKLRTASYQEMLAFITRLYKQGFEDGANSTVEEGVFYIKIDENVKYICENCGAELQIKDIE